VSATPPATGVAVPSDTEAFFVRGGQTGCLLLHGFTGTPQEMRFLGSALAARGHTVSGVRLAGHATQVEELAATRWTDWYESARAGLEALQPQVERVVVVGQSMGALLALELAATHPEAVAAVVVLAPALVIRQRMVQVGAPIFPMLLPFLPVQRRFVSKAARDIADPLARAESPSYERVPLRALTELVHLQRRVRRRLRLVRQPVLAIHARQDHTCPVVNVEILSRELGGSVQVRLLPESYHVISLDVERELVATLVGDFAESVAAGVSAIAP